MPTRAVSGSKGAEQNQRQDAVFREVRHFANDKMNRLELFDGQAGKNPVRNRVKQRTGVFSGK